MLAIAWRNFHRQLHRFQVILAALVLGVAIMVALLGIVAGMTDSLREKAARYFSGDVAVFSLDPDRTVTEAGRVRRALETLPGFQSLCRRTEYLFGDATVFFGGDAVRQRKLVGIDWAVEAASFRGLDWRAGGPPRPGDSHGILVSTSTADRLHLRLGDEVTVSFLTMRKQGNSLNLIVRGIFADTSFFGYASYLDIDTFNEALGQPVGSATALGAILEPGVSAKEFGKHLVEELRTAVPTYPLVESRAALTHIMDSRRHGDFRLVVMTLDANLAEITTILSALLVVAGLACGFFLVILMIGVGNTYRMIVFERTQEIGTMRAMGMSRPRLMALLLTEAVVLASAGLIGGLVLGGGLLLVSAIPDWSGSALVVLFTENGHLVPRLPLAQLGVLVVVLLVTTLGGAWIPARHAVRMKPVDALREGE